MTSSDQLLAARWAALKKDRRAALIPYITAGFPDAGATRAVLQGAAAAGADFLELGVPWSDPVADGPVIQASSHAALRAGTTLASVLDMVKSVKPDVPVVMFSYLNPILAFGPARFAREARAAGAAAILVTDLPVGVDDAVEKELKSTGLPLVRLVAPTSAPARVAEIAAQSEGFVYLVARTGVTGKRTTVGAELKEKVKSVRAATTLPVAVGFGITSADDAAQAAELADGVAVGTALVERMKTGGAPAALSFIRELRGALD